MNEPTYTWRLPCTSSTKDVVHLMLTDGTTLCGRKLEIAPVEVQPDWERCWHCKRTWSLEYGV